MSLKVLNLSLTMTQWRDKKKLQNATYQTILHDQVKPGTLRGYIKSLFQVSINSMISTLVEVVEIFGLIQYQ